MALQRHFPRQTHGDGATEPEESLVIDAQASSCFMGGFSKVGSVVACGFPRNAERMLKMGGSFSEGPFMLDLNRSASLLLAICRASCQVLIRLVFLAKDGTFRIPNTCNWVKWLAVCLFVCLFVCLVACLLASLLGCWFSWSSVSRGGPGPVLAPVFHFNIL